LPSVRIAGETVDHYYVIGILDGGADAIGLQYFA